jgi:hypothetical protein
MRIANSGRPDEALLDQERSRQYPLPSRGTDVKTKPPEKNDLVGEVGSFKFG